MKEIKGLEVVLTDNASDEDWEMIRTIIEAQAKVMDVRPIVLRPCPNRAVELTGKKQ